MRKLYIVYIDHIFIQRDEPIRFTSEEDLQASIQKAVKDTPASGQRTFEFATLEEANLKANEVKNGFWKFDEGYSRPKKWFYFDMEVAQIVEEEIQENGDFGEEAISKSEFYHPDIPFENGSYPVIEEICFG